MNALVPLLLLPDLSAPLSQEPASSASRPPERDPAKERLDKSPRHHEWIDVKQGGRAVRCFVAYPEVKEKVMAVLVIHENKGLTDWVRSVADQVAEAGYLAIAPDLLSGEGPKGGNTDSFERVDAATQAIYKLDPAQVTADLHAVADHALKLPASNGKLCVAGFCWGGMKSFDFATKRKGLAAAFVFYGNAPKDESTLKSIDCPVYGFYGERDGRITETVPATSEAMKKAGKTYEPTIYAGAGHGFLRAGELPDASAPDRKARTDAWERWKEVLRKRAG
jgi:carboxymethylenebutenolidase